MNAPASAAPSQAALERWCRRVRDDERVQRSRLGLWNRRANSSLPEILRSGTPTTYGSPRCTGRSRREPAGSTPSASAGASSVFGSWVSSSSGCCLCSQPNPTAGANVPAAPPAPGSPPASRHGAHRRQLPGVVAVSRICERAHLLWGSAGTTVGACPLQRAVPRRAGGGGSGGGEDRSRAASLDHIGTPSAPSLHRLALQGSGEAPSGQLLALACPLC